MSEFISFHHMNEQVDCPSHAPITLCCRSSLSLSSFCLPPDDVFQKSKHYCMDDGRFIHWVVNFWGLNCKDITRRSWKGEAEREQDWLTSVADSISSKRKGKRCECDVYKEHPLLNRLVAKTCSWWKEERWWMEERKARKLMEESHNYESELTSGGRGGWRWCVGTGSEHSMTE